MTQRIRVLVGFDKYTDQQLATIAGSALKGMTGNKAFANPPVDLAVVQTALDDFNGAIAAQVNGGPPATAAKNNKRDVLIGHLKKLAHYVQISCGNDLETLLTSGFSAAPSATSSSSPLTRPSILSVDNGASTQLLVRVTRIQRARCYEVRAAAIGAGGAPGPWQGGNFFTNSRSMPVNGLTPGTNYSFQARAIGGSSGFSDWSDPVVHMAT